MLVYERINKILTPSLQVEYFGKKQMHFLVN